MREDIEKQISDIHGNANMLYVKRKNNNNKSNSTKYAILICVIRTQIAILKLGERRKSFDFHCMRLSREPLECSLREQ